MNSKKMIVLAAFALLFTASAAHAQLGTTAPTATIEAIVNPEMALTIQTPALVLTQTGNNFSNYTGTVNYTYFIRTTTVGGSSRHRRSHDRLQQRDRQHAVGCSSAHSQRLADLRWRRQRSGNSG